MHKSGSVTEVVPHRGEWSLRLSVGPVEGHRHRPAWILDGLLGLLLIFACLGVVRYFDGGPVGDRELFHPEAIYPLALWMSVDSGVDIGRWSTPYAPYYFPDGWLYWTAWKLTGDAVWAVYLFGLLQFLAFVALAVAALSSLCAVERRATVRRGVVLTAICLCLGIQLGWDGGARWVQLWVGAFHGGAVLLTLAGLWAVHRIHREATPAGLNWQAFVLAGVVFWGMGSDRLMLPLFLLPALLIRGFRPLRPGWWLLLLSSGALGWMLPAAVAALGGPTTPAPVISSTVGWTPVLNLLGREDAVYFVWHQFFGRFGAVYRLFFLLWLGVTWHQAFRAPTQALRRFHGFVLCSSALTLGAAAFVGLQVYGPRSGSSVVLFVHRYLLLVYLWPLLTPWLLAASPPRILEKLQRRAAASGWAGRWATAWAVVGLAAASLQVGLWLRSSHPGEFPAYRPPETVCLDDLARRHGLRFGWMHFHRAQRLNVFSRSGLHVDQVTADAEPMYWIDSRPRAELEPGFRGYDFVLLRGLRDPARVVEVMGPPSAVAPCPGSEVWIYSPPRAPRW